MILFDTAFREAAKKALFLVVGPLRGGGVVKAGPLGKIPFLGSKIIHILL